MEDEFIGAMATNLPFAISTFHLAPECKINDDKFWLCMGHKNINRIDAVRFIAGFGTHLNVRGFEMGWFSYHILCAKCNMVLYLILFVWLVPYLLIFKGKINNLAGDKNNLSLSKIKENVSYQIIFVEKNKIWQETFPVVLDSGRLFFRFHMTFKAQKNKLKLLILQ